MIEQSDVGIGQWTITTLRARARWLARARARWLALWTTVALGAGGCDVMAVLDGGGDAENTAGYGALSRRMFISESVTENDTPKDLVEGTRISLGFTEDYPATCGSCFPRTLSAHLGCNFIRANDVAVHADHLEFGGVGVVTETSCGSGGYAQDDWLVGFLAASPVWALADSRLTLVNDGTEIVLLDRELANPDRPLIGTTWIVNTIVRGATVSSMHAKTKGKAWLRIDGNTFSASSGCGEQVDGNVVYPDHLRQNSARKGT